jgi:septal ring-binding cell division protein DamX
LNNPNADDPKEILMLDTPRGDLTHSTPTHFPGGGGQAEETGGKKDKKGRKRAEMARSLAALGAELARLDVALRRLDDRVGHLHSVQWAQQEANSVTASKISGLAEAVERASADAAATGNREQELRAALSQLEAAVESLRAEAGVITESLADIAAQPDRDTALFVMEDRIAAAEELIAAIQPRLDAAQPAPGIGADLEQALSDLESLRLQVADGLRGQNERISSLEQQLGGQLQALTVAIPSEERWSEAHRGLREDVDSRLQSLSRELENEHQRAEAARAQQHDWTQQHLASMSRKFAFGLGTLGLILLALSAANWWHSDAKFDSVAAGLANQAKARAPDHQGAPVAADVLGTDSAVDRLTATIQTTQAENSRLAERLYALQTPERIAAADDMRARVQRLEQAQSDLQRSAKESAKLAASLSARIDTVGRTQQTAAGQEPAAAGQGTANSPPAPPSVGLAALANAPVRQSVSHGSTPAAERPDPNVPAAPADRHYVIQLIGFRSKSSLEPFAQRFGVASRARYMRSTYRGKDWYVVLIGNYATEAEGLAAARQLPDKLRKLKPWVRRLPASSQLFRVE